MVFPNKFEQLEADHIAIIGMPFDDYSSHLKGAANAPPLIREMITSDASNTWSELGLDVGNHPYVHDLGDLSWHNNEEAFEVLEATINKVVTAGAKPLTFGGDHSITYPILKGLSKHYPKLTILHFDAHPDLYDTLDGNRLSHACPFARIMENKLATRLVQIGIRTLNQHQKDQASKFDVEIHEMKDWNGPEQLSLSGPIYISLDIDALDPAYAPGVSHHEPGGLSTRQVIDVIHSIDAPIVGADIVEYNPIRDINSVTATVAAKLYKEICSRILTN